MKTGKCMCGAISFAAKNAPDTFHACACDMCRRVTGGQFLSVWMPLADIEIDGAVGIQTIQSSDWAERAFCGNCGSPMWYRLRGEHPDVGLSLGLFDDIAGMHLVDHYYADKPICALMRQDATNPLTGPETEAKFAAMGGDQ